MGGGEVSLMKRGKRDGGMEGGETVRKMTLRFLYSFLSGVTQILASFSPSRKIPAQQKSFFGENVVLWVTFFQKKDIVFYSMAMYEGADGCIGHSPRSNPLLWALHMGRAFCFSDDRVEELQQHLEVTARGPPPPPKGTNIRTRLNKVTNNFQCLILAVEKPFFLSLKKLFGLDS